MKLKENRGKTYHRQRVRIQLHVENIKQFVQILRTVFHLINMYAFRREQYVSLFQVLFSSNFEEMIISVCQYNRILYII
jgi:hypothetical protein